MDRGLSANTVLRRHANIRKSLKYAFQIGLIDSNPADRIQRPKKQSYSASYYNTKELEELFLISKGDPMELAILMAAFYGLRRSEIIGLKWNAIDFVNKTITIKFTVTEVSTDKGNKLIDKEKTKTKSSHRSLPLVKVFEDALIQKAVKQKQYISLCGHSYCNDYLDFIFVNEIGERMKPGYLTQHFSRILKNNHLRKIRFHDLRHSCASLLYANHVDLKQIQAWLGHSDISTTSNIYTHFDYSQKIASANAISAILTS